MRTDRLMNLNPINMVVVLAISGCANTSWEDYYANRSDPTIAGLDVESESGNNGGNTIVISGAGFGDSADEIVVLLGNHNAEVTAIEDSSITITSPRGPITGGLVDLIVATDSGYAELEAAYTYEILTADGTALHNGQTGYILAQNFFASCAGGLWDNPSSGFCNQLAYVGEVGITGSAEFLKFSYPRVHTSGFGWVGNTDYSPGEWTFVEAAEMVFPSGFDDLRRQVGEVSLTNSQFLGTDYCVDATIDPVQNDNKISCDNSDSIRYDLGRMEYCETQDPESGGTFEYQADWLIPKNFFQASSDVDDHFSTVDIGVEVPEAGLDNTTLRLPGAIQLVGSVGFGDPENWSVDQINDCPDANDNGEATLDENGFVLTWEPITEELGGQGGLESYDSYVQVSVTYLPIGWYGLNPGGPRAVVSVPDEFEVDPVTGMSTLALPNSVLYQFPTPNGSWSNFTQFTGGELGSWESQAAYMIIEVYRVTDYTIESEFGPTVFSYVTGDLSFGSLTTGKIWTNPAEQGDCFDCLDGDGDGWSDDLDPDCMVGGTGEEVNSTSSTECNDGIDNDGDGRIDDADVDCEDGADDAEDTDIDTDIDTDE